MYRQGSRMRRCLLLMLCVCLCLCVSAAFMRAETAPKQSQTPVGGGQHTGSSLQHTGASPATLTTVPRPKTTLQTPFQRLLEPQLRKMLAARPKAQRSGATLLQPRAQESGAGDPNFGGFLAVPSYSTGAGPAQWTDNLGGDLVTSSNSVVIAFAVDVNGDGSPDLIAVQFDGAVSVLLNNGHGGFTAPVINTSAQTAGAKYPPEFVNAVATDVNHDGYPDLIVQDGSNQYTNNELWVFLNNGNGTFAAPSQVKPKFVITNECTIGSIAGFAVGDVTGDGNPDIVAVSPCGYVATYVGNGQGSFNTANAPQSQTPGGATTGLQLVGGKLNLILISSVGNNGAVVGMPSNGDGTFSAANTLVMLPAGAGDALNLQFQDVNADGIPDIVLSDGDGNLYVALGESNGSFQPPVSSIGGYTAVYPKNFALVDVNGDGLPDFIDQEEGYASVYLNNGNAAFGGPSGIAATNYATGLNAGQLAVADFNGDGKSDFANIDLWYGRASIFLSNGNGSFQGASQIAEATPEPAVPDQMVVTTALDVNGDGKQDILVGNEAGVDTGLGVLQIQSGISDGKGGFTYKTALSQSSTYNIDDILTQTGDFNGDGLQDIILYSYSSSDAPVISVSLSNGDGTFKQAVPIQLPNSPLQLPANVAVGDVNGDGKQDLVIAYEGDGSAGVPSGYYVALGNGDGTFQTATFVPYGNELYIPVLADVNGDGNPDLILVDDPFINLVDPFQVTVLLGNGTGAFNSASPLTLATNNAVIANAFVGDLNLDGKPDVVLFSAGQLDPLDSSHGVLVDGTEGVLVLLGNGDGTFGAPTQLAAGIAPAGGAVEDFNGDGIPDIVFSLFNDGDNLTETYYGVSTLLGNGDGTFTQPANMNTLVLPASDNVLPGNYLGDNTLGLVVSGLAVGGSSLLLNEGGTSVTLGAAEPTVNAGEEETLTVTVTPTVAAQLTPTGTVTFLLGTTVLGQESLSDGTASLTTSALPVGSDAITVSYSGDSTFNAYAKAASLNVTVAPALTTTTVQASPDPAAPGVTVTLQATVSSAWTGTATGTVTFYDGSTQLGTGTLTNGSASYTTSSLAAGNHSITATYSGDGNFSGGTSAPVTELIEAPAISLSVNPTALTMTDGQTGTVTLTLAANAAYSGSVSLAATGTPAYTSISFSSSSVTLAGSQTQLVTVTIATDVSITAAVSRGPGWAASGGATLAGLILILLPRRRRRALWPLVLIAVIASLASLAAITGCGGSGSSSATPKGTSVVTIMATPSGSGTAVQTTLNLIVQ
jgi:hypothetical protein